MTRRGWVPSGPGVVWDPERELEWELDLGPGELDLGLEAPTLDLAEIQRVRREQGTIAALNLVREYRSSRTRWARGAQSEPTRG